MPATSSQKTGRPFNRPQKHLPTTTHREQDASGSEHIDGASSSPSRPSPPASASESLSSVPPAAEEAFQNFCSAIRQRENALIEENEALQAALNSAKQSAQATKSVLKGQNSSLNDIVLRQKQELLDLNGSLEKTRAQLAHQQIMSTAFKGQLQESRLQQEESMNRTRELAADKDRLHLQIADLEKSRAACDAKQTESDRTQMQDWSAENLKLKEKLKAVGFHQSACVTCGSDVDDQL